MRQLNWFSSYLQQRLQRVRCSSTPSVLRCGVPKGSVLGPILFFFLYSVDRIKLIIKYGLHPHLYVDDTQIYGFCPPTGTQALLDREAECINDMSSWMRSNCLQLNTAKTEALWCASTRQQHLIPSDPVSVCSDLVMPAKYVRDLGIYINCDMSMKTHVSRTVSSCFAALR